MKKISFFVFILLSALTISCSEEENSTPDNTVDDNDYFEYKMDGDVVPIDSWTALRSEDRFEVMGEAGDGSSIFFSFNADGDLARATSTPGSLSNNPWLNSHYEFTSNYFDFEIVAIDEANKIIKVNYSGNLYEEEFDLSSPSIPVEGTFNVHYIQVTPQIPGLGLKATIGNSEWNSVKYTTTISGFDDVTLDFNSDDAYKIALNFSNENLTVGTYEFTSSSTPKVTLSKYDPATQTYTDYACNGTLVITDRSPVGVHELLTGTFSFTAINPETNVTIQVTNGSFKEIFSN